MFIILYFLFVFSLKVHYFKQMDTSELANIIVARRKELGWGQKELAAIAQVSRGTVINAENNSTDITWRRLQRILAALNLSISIKPGKGRPTESELEGLFKDD